MKPQESPWVPVSPIGSKIVPVQDSPIRSLTTKLLGSQTISVIQVGPRLKLPHMKPQGILLHERNPNNKHVNVIWCFLHEVSNQQTKIWFYVKYQKSLPNKYSVKLSAPKMPKKLQNSSLKMAFLVFTSFHFFNIKSPLAFMSLHF